MTDDGEAGPILDRLIAEKVMGWTVHQWSLQPSIIRARVFTNREHELREYVKAGAKVYLIVDDRGEVSFEPTTHIAHAMEMTLHLVSKGFDCGLFTQDDHWTAYFSHRDDQPPLYAAKTAALALCLAAISRTKINQPEA